MGCAFSSHRHVERQGNRNHLPTDSTTSNQVLTARQPILGPNVPTEIHLAIAEHLPQSAVVALALTCKQFFNTFGTNLNSCGYPRSERSEFLSLLERNLVDCYHRVPSDNRLKKRDATSTPQTLAPAQHGPECAYKILANRFNYTITLSHFALALKRDAYGGEHGIALDSFHYRASRTLEPLQQSQKDRFHVDLEVTPKIVAARFLLRCNYHIYRKGGAKPMQMHELSSFDLHLCRHVGTQHYSFPWFCQSLSDKLRPRRYNDEENDYADDAFTFFSTFDSKPQDSARGRCSFCMTEWAVTTPADGDGLDITTWQNFGHRQSALLVWKTIVGGYLDYYCRIVNFPAGCVRDAFESGQGGKLESVDMRI